MGPRTGMDRCGKSRHHWDSIPDRPALSQLLDRLRYPAHGKMKKHSKSWYLQEKGASKEKHKVHGRRLFELIL